MLEPRYLGSTRGIKLLNHNDYIAECTYKYVKSVDKYLLSVRLNQYDNKGKEISSHHVGTQYISGTRDTIIDNICKIVERIDSPDYFEKCVNPSPTVA